MLPPQGQNTAAARVRAMDAGWHDRRVWCGQRAVGRGFYIKSTRSGLETEAKFRASDSQGMFYLMDFILYASMKFGLCTIDYQAWGIASECISKVGTYIVIGGDCIGLGASQYS
jgi:hypothetical protein